MANVNWSEKLLKMNQKLDDNGNLDKNKVDNILVSIQTLAPEALAPAVIINEDDTFLEILILNLEGEDSVINTIVLKSSIQSIGIIGGVEIEDINEINNIFDM